jgi:NAD(P)-dependent dehydrogenase (short-subunit alcohol dehydrogenase family)
MPEAPKTILITGASSGFGAAIAGKLAAAGHRVYGTSRHARPDQGAVRMLVLDVTDPASIAVCLQTLLAEAGRLDVLINNAGNGICGAIEDSSIAEAQAQLDTNFFGPARMIHAVLPRMRAQGSGRIITVGSLAGHAALPFQAYYSASKFALEGLNEALRLELSGSKIDATIICPGDFRTGFTAARVFTAAARAGANTERLHRTVQIYERDENNGADPEDVAALVARLVAAPRVKTRYLVGKFDQRLGITLKRVLPAGWFEAIMRSTYKL